MASKHINMLAWVIARMDKARHGRVQLVLSVCVPNQNRPVLGVTMSDCDHSLLNDLVQDLLSNVHVKITTQSRLSTVCAAAS